jgi:predicted nuclease with RNAse H fold
MRTLSLGIDVSLSRGLDLVVMNEQLQIKDVRNAGITELAAVIQDRNPSIIAIDSPPKFGVEGNSRLAERELNSRGINIFYTPSDSAKCCNPYYAWMEVGHECFKLASLYGFETFFGAGSLEKRAIEVYPHANAVVLTGCCPPRGWLKKRSDKRQWRWRPLEALGIDTVKLKSMDQVDAALAALTGLYALQKRFVTVGCPSEGVIVLPTERLLNRYSRKD